MAGSNLPENHATDDPKHITLYGATWCGDCKRAKKFLGEQKIHYDWVDVEENTEGLAYVELVNGGKTIIPVLRFGDNSTLVEPTNAQLAEKLEIQTRAERTFYDLIVVGGGPTGLTAAIYAAREGIETLVIERSGLGGQAGITERLDNFPGFPDGISGAEFAERITSQARNFGVELLAAQNVASIADDGMYKVVQTESGDEYRSRALLLAPGSTYKRLGVPGEEDFVGAGVHFCATCDGPFYKGKEVFVIGGGNSAGEEGIFLTRFSSKVTLVIRKEHLSATKVVAEKVRSHPKIELLPYSEVIEFTGDKRLRSLTIKNIKSGEVTEHKPAAVFVFVGLEPNSDFIRGVVALDERNFIVTSKTLETSKRGIFAAGDARAGSTKQVASAVGEGATAALMIREFLKEAGEVMRSMVEEPVEVG